MRVIGLSFAVAAALAACGAPPTAQRGSGPAIASRVDGPPGAAPGTCWTHDQIPAKIETVTEEILVSPGDFAHDGIVLREPVYRTETEERVISEARSAWFQTPCDGEITHDLRVALQRALAARGLYEGAFDGRLSAQTKAAIQAYQRPYGLDSPILSRDAAVRLGLIVAAPTPPEPSLATAPAPPAPTPPQTSALDATQLY